MCVVRGFVDGEPPINVAAIDELLGVRDSGRNGLRGPVEVEHRTGVSGNYVIMGGALWPANTARRAWAFAAPSPPASSARS